jgi:hypothetical protein
MTMNKLITFLLIAISTQALALDSCLSGIFEHVTKERTGLTLNFQDDGVAYGYWWGIQPCDGSAREGLPSWSELYGVHHNELNFNEAVVEMNINTVWLESMLWEEWKAGYGFQGKLFIYASDPDHFIVAWSLLTGNDGLPCQGVCDGEFVIRRVTKPPVGCE